MSAVRKQREIPRYPRIQRGFFHLTPGGWVRQDRQPFPADRIETWAYEMECPAEDAKEQICLTRTWTNPSLSEQGRSSFHALHGQPIEPQTNRNVKFECEV